MFFPRCASWYAFWGRRPCCMKSCTVCTGAVSPRCYFTFSLSSSSFCKNFVGNADNEHNGTIKRKGSLFFGDERKSSKPEKLKKWGWCARDFCEDALSTGERDIGAKKRQVLLDPSKKLLLPKHNMHTFKILIHSMEKKVTNITLSSPSSLSWSLAASSSALWKYGKFSVWTFMVCESRVTDWWVKSMTPIQVVLRSYQKSEKESLNWNEPLFLVRKCAKFHWFFAIFSNYFQFAKFHLKECHISLIFCQNAIVPNFIDILPFFINIVPSHN